MMCFKTEKAPFSRSSNLLNYKVKAYFLAKYSFTLSLGTISDLKP